MADRFGIRPWEMGTVRLGELSAIGSYLEEERRA
jgi:hypothetical protein